MADLTDEERIDKYLKRSAPIYPTNYGIVDFLELELKDEDSDLASYRIATRMEAEGLGIEIDCDTFRLTQQGLEIAKLGYLNHLKAEQKKAQETEQRIEMEAHKLKYELLNNKWLYKTRWWPLIISIIALIASLYALFKPAS